MHRYSDIFVNKIREIRRREKISFQQIGKRFNIPSSTIRNWCFDLGITRRETLMRFNAFERKKLKESELSVVPNSNKITVDEAKFISAIMYGCEGSKYPAHSGISFSNSEPNLVLTFLKLLKKAFRLDVNKFSIHLQIHTTHDYQQIRDFWSKLLKLPEKCFIKPTIKLPRGGKHRNDYLGTCTLRYHDYRIQLKLLGIYEAFIKKDTYKLA